MALNVLKTIKKAREAYPGTFGHQTDEEILGYLQHQFPNKDWGEHAIKEEEEKSPAAIDYEDIDDSPGAVSNLLLWNANVALADDYDWAKRGYNNSLAGNAYKMMYGKPKYNVEEFDDKWYHDVLGFFLGMTNPLEVGLFVGSGGVGAAGGKALTSKLFTESTKKGLIIAAGKKEVKDKIFRNYLLKKAPIEGALGLGTYSAAAGTIQRYGQQSVEIEEGTREDFGHLEAMGGIASDFMHGSVLGAMGGIVKAPMAMKFAKASRRADVLAAKGLKIPSSLAATKIANSPIGQVLAESQAFTLGQTMEEGIVSGEMPSMEDWWQKTFTNVGIIGGLRAGSKIYRKAFTMEAGNDVSRYYDAKRKMFTDAFGPQVGRVSKYQRRRGEGPLDNAKEAERLENTKQNLEEAGITVPEEVLNRLAEIEAEHFYATQEPKIIKSKMKRLKTLEEKATDKDGNIDLNKLTKAESGEFGELATSVNLWKLDFYETLKSEPEIAREVFKDIVGKKPTDTQDKMITGIIEGRIENGVRVSEMFNDLAKGQKPKGIKEKKKIEVVEEKTDIEIQEEKVSELAALKEITTEEIKNQSSYKPLIHDPKNPNKLNIKAIERDIKAERDKLKSKSETKDIQTEKEIIKEINEPDKLIDPVDEKYTERTPTSGPDEGKPIVIKTLNKLIQKVKNTGETISDTNKKIINYIIRQPDKLPREISTGKSQPKSATAYTTEVINFAKFLKDKNVSLISNFKTVEKEIMSYISHLESKGYTNDYIRQRMSNLRKFYDLYGKVGEGKNIESAPGIASLLGDSKRLGISGKGKGKYEITTPGSIEKAITKVYDYLTGNKKSVTVKVGKETTTLSPQESKNLIEIFYETGARPEDIVNLKLDTSGKAPKLVWIEKKHGEVAVAQSLKISPKDAAAYKKHITDTTGGFKDYDSLFPNLQGKSTGTINSIVKEVFKKAGVKLQRKDRQTGETFDDLSGLQAGRIFRKRKLGELASGEAQILSEKLRHKGGPEATEAMGYIEPEGEVRKIPGKVYERRLTARPEGETVFKGKDVDTARSTFIQKVAKKNNLSEKELREAGLDEGVMGEFAEGEIRLARGEWQPADFYHENMHRLKDFAKLTGNKKLLKLIEGGEKLGRNTKEFKEWKKNNPNRNMEEFLNDIVGGKTSRIQFTKGMLPKVKQFVKQLVSQMKVAFGVGNFKDISRVLAGKVGKGFTTEGVKFGKEVKQRKLVEKLGLEEERARVTGRTLSQGMKKVFKNLKVDIKDEAGKKGMISMIAEMAGIENFESFKLNPRVIEEPSLQYDNLKKFESTLSQMEAGKIKRIIDKKKWFKTFKTVDLMRLNEKNLTDAVQRKILKSFGVRDGNIWNSSQQQLDNYKNILHTMNTQKSTGSTWVDEAVLERKARAGDTRFSKPYAFFKREVPRAIYPIYKVFEKLGYKKLSNKMKSHFAAEAGHLGEGHDTFLNDVVKGFRSNIDNNGNKLKAGQEISIEGIGNRGFNKIKNSLWSMDHRGERILENLKFLKENKESLSSKQIKEINEAEAFFNKAFKKEFFRDTKGKKAGANLKKYINYSTPEGRVVERYIKFTKYYENMLKVMLQKNMNEAQYERFLKEGNIRFITDGIYLTRQVTRKYKELVDLDSKEINKIVDDNTTSIAYKLAQEQYKTLKPNNEQIGNVQTKARKIALEEIFDASNFALDKISSKFLIKRNMKLPEFIKDANGKWIRVYETSFDGTAARYSVGMSKFLATMEYFPEFAKIKGFKKSGAKELLGEIKTKAETQGEAEWMTESFNMRIGVGEANPFEVLTRTTQKTANILAKVGLSGPTSGLKNIITGTVGTLYAMELADIGRGFSDIIRGEARSTIKTGYDSVSMAHLVESGRIVEFFDKYFFTLGGMKPTEKLNRSLVILASKYDQRRMFQNMKDSNPGEKKYERANERLKDFYELTPEEIKVVQKHGFNIENVNIKDFKTTREFVIEKRNLQNSFQKMDTFAHVKTQGSSADIFMPKLASGQFIRPLTLYKRMAYAATVNTGENIRRAIKSGDYMKLISGTVGTYVGGRALMGVYWHLLGVPMPDENDPWWKRTATFLWKGEMLGILSEYYSPYDSSMAKSLYPSIFDTLTATLGTISSVGKGHKKVFGKDQGLDTMLRKTFNIYNLGTKVIERRFNHYNRDMLRFRALWKDYEEDVLETPSSMFEANELTKYRIDLRNAFNLGTDEEFTKTYVVLRHALASDFMQRGYADSPRKGLVVQIRSEGQAYKIADEKLNTMIKSLNPNPSYIRKGQEPTTKLRRIEFRDWLVGRTFKDKEGTLKGQQLEKRLLELEGEYLKKIIGLKKSMPYHLRKLNQKKLASKFNLKH